MNSRANRYERSSNNGNFVNGKRILAAGALAAVGLSAGAAFASAERHSENYNDNLHADTSQILSNLSHADAQPGIAIVDGNEVTSQSLKDEKMQVRHVLSERFSSAQTITVRVDQLPSEALWEAFSSSWYHPDIDVSLRQDNTLDQSEQMILTILRSTQGEMNPDVARELAQDVENVHTAMEHDDTDLQELEEKLEDEVKALADATFRDNDTIHVPNYQ